LNLYKNFSIEKVDFQDGDFIQKLTEEKKEVEKLAFVCKFTAEKGQAYFENFKGSEYWQKKSNNFLYCNHSFDVALFEDDTRKFLNGDFCNSRFCSICTPRNAQKRANEMIKIIKHRQTIDNFNYAFLTLTQKNCGYDTLGALLKKINYAFDKMQKYKRWKECVLGFHISLEVTYNKRIRKFHPHSHIIIEYEKGCYSKKKTYLKQEEVSKMWKKAMGLDYSPVVDIRAINSESSIEKAIYEATKYSVKGSDILIIDRNTRNVQYNDSSFVLQVFDYELKGKQLFRYGGSLLKSKQYIRALELAEKYKINNEKMIEMIAHIEVYGWNYDSKEYGVLFIKTYEEYIDYIEKMKELKEYRKAVILLVS
jgi:plasmid rolling circle replication initiator protein Rep